jgi:uncharacterized protein YidB (DUF937 family)
MGLLDGVLGGALGGGQQRRGHSLGSTVAAGVVLALLVKGVRQYQATHPQGASPQGRSFDPQQQPQQIPQGGAMSQPAQGGLGGILGGLLGGGRGGGLGGMLGGGNLGGLLGGLGGAGALGALLSQFQQKGYGQQVNSWVSPGPNEPIAPDQLADALGEETVEALQQETGMPRQALLSDLSQALPEAVNEVTPQGRAPDDEELHQIASGSGPLGS